MTIKEYLDGLPDIKAADGSSLKNEMCSSMHVWDNNTCRGYCIDAMRRAGLDTETVRKVNGALRFSFDELTNEQADEVYYNFYFDL